MIIFRSLDIRMDLDILFRKMIDLLYLISIEKTFYNMRKAIYIMREIFTNQENNLQDQGSYLQNQESNLYFVIIILIFREDLYFFVS